MKLIYFNLVVLLVVETADIGFADSPFNQSEGIVAKELPTVDVTSFEEIVNNRFVYVDKTAFILKMMNEPKKKYYLLVGPVRTGKSLLLSTVEEIFNGRKELFQGTKIHDSKEFGWSKYPVIRLDFGKYRMPLAEFKRDLKIDLEEAAKSHKIALTTNSSKCRTAEGCLKRLLPSLQKKYKKSVVILIDDYDRSYANLISGDQWYDQSGTSLKKKKENVVRPLRQFFEVMRSETVFIRFCFITGISEFSKTDILTRGRWPLPAFHDISSEPEYATILGFTHQEVQTYLNHHVRRAAFANKVDEQIIYNRIRHKYGKFEKELYNPRSVILYLNKAMGKSSQSFS